MQDAKNRSVVLTHNAGAVMSDWKRKYRRNAVKVVRSVLSWFLEMYNLLALVGFSYFVIDELRESFNGELSNYP